MEEIKYRVFSDEAIIAEGMILDDALIFMKAYAETYYSDMKCGCKLSLQEMK